MENRSTLDVLEKLNKTVFDKYKFATVTFEHDMYAAYYDFFLTRYYIDTKNRSKEIFQKRGYILLFEDVMFDDKYNRKFEDWYVHPELVDINIIYKICEEAKNNNCMYEPNTNYPNLSIIKNMNCRDIFNILQKI